MDPLLIGILSKALLGSSFVGVVCGIAGPYLVLRRLSFLGASLSHSAMGLWALVLALGIESFWVTVLGLVLLGLFMEFLFQQSKLPADSVNVVVFSLGASTGLIVAGVHPEGSKIVSSVFFGSLYTLTDEDILILAALSTLCFGVFFKLKHAIAVSLFNPDIARMRGYDVSKINYLLVAVVSLSVAVAVKTVGVLLASSLLILPSLTALRLSSSFLGTLKISLITSIFAFWIGIGVSFLFDLPPSGAVVLSACGLFLVSLAKRKLRPIFKGIKL